MFAHTVEARRSVHPLVLLALLAVAGCARSIDASKVRGPDQPAVTIPYTGVREESRLYPDYGHIDGSILTETPAAKPAKKGKSP